MTKSKIAVIYARVSSAQQVTEGDGLASQETRCREYANYKGYTVVEVFSDKGVSGGLVDRPAMKEMLGWLRARRAEAPVVIIDDISRLARGLEAHGKLRSAIGSVGASLESPSIEFGDDADSRMVENLMATVSQHQREKNAEQVRNRMRARCLNGYWVFHAPLGYRYEKAKTGGGKVLVRDEPCASIIIEAFKGYASGRFGSLAEVTRFFESQPAFPKDLPNGHVRQWKVNKIFTNRLYAGYIEVPRWKIGPLKGQHQSLVSLATFEEVQERLNGKSFVYQRRDHSRDFPLRGFVCCDSCGSKMTAGWSKGKYKHYAYYTCWVRDCDQHGKSVPRARIEDGFEELLKSLQPSPALFRLVEAVFRDAWERRLGQTKGQKADLRKQKKQVERDIENAVDKLMDASSPSVVRACEGRISKLETEKALIEEKLAQKEDFPRTFDELFELSLRLLSSPWKIWSSGEPSLRNLVLKLTFADRITYCRENGLRTPNLSLPFKVLGDLECPEKSMVPPERIELSTSSLPMMRSTPELRRHCRLGSGALA